MKKKMKKMIRPVLGISMLMGAYYLMNKNKSNMLDVIIEEIEAMR